MSRNTPWRVARQQFALHQGTNDWYRIRNQANGPTQVHIYDEIGYFGVTAGDFIRDLADVTGPIEVHLNSPGGEVFDGIAIYNALIARRDCAVIIDGIAASIASVIAMAGNPVLIARQGQLMMHEGFAMAVGNAQDMRDLAEQLDRTSGTIADIYAEHTGKPQAYWRQKMKAETWFLAGEAIEEGLVDRMVESAAGRPPPEINQWDWGIFRNAGRQPSDAATVPYVSERQTRHEPMTGRHRHDHAAAGSDDHDDGQHSHMHDHNNDADHYGHDHSGMSNQDENGSPFGTYEEYGSRIEVTFSNGVVAVYNWDAAAALAKCKSASDFRSICAGEHSAGDPDTAAHWALPHHNSPGAGPDKGGVVAALGRWNQTKDLKNKDGAHSHLLAHAKALGLPSGDEGNQAGTDILAGLSDEDYTRFAESLKL